MRIGLIDFDSKIPNLALMKLSAFHKSLGHNVILNPHSPASVDKAYCSVIFEKNREKAAMLQDVYANIEFGGTGWDLKTELPTHIENIRPDYDLYTVGSLYTRVGGIMTKDKRIQKVQTLINAGIGFTTRGCVRSCPFCIVPDKEGRLRKASEIKDIINPKSNVIILLDANFTADPDCEEKLREIAERKLIVDFTQGIDIRCITDLVGLALSKVRHLRSIHYAWDLMNSENAVIRGINILSRFIPKWKHLCYVLVGFNTSFEEDIYRFRKLTEIGVDPYIMIYNQSQDARLKHFARWINSKIYKVCSFDDYKPWRKIKDAYLSSQWLSFAQDS